MPTSYTIIWPWLTDYSTAIIHFLFLRKKLWYELFVFCLINCLECIALIIAGDGEVSAPTLNYFQCKLIRWNAYFFCDNIKKSQVQEQFASCVCIQSAILSPSHATQEGNILKWRFHYEPRFLMFLWYIKVRSVDTYITISKMWYRIQYKVWYYRVASRI